MRKLIILCLIGVFCASGMAFAGQGRVDTVFENESLAAYTATTSAIYDVKGSSSFGVWLNVAANGGVPSVNISYQMSPDKTEANFTTPTTVTALFSELNVEGNRVLAFTPAPMRYIRFVASGTQASSTATTVSMKLFTRE